MTRISSFCTSLRLIRAAALMVCMNAACGGGNDAKNAPAPAAPSPRSDRTELIWVDRSGARVADVGITGRLRAARISPDGTRVAWLDGDGRLSLRLVAGGEPLVLTEGGTGGFAWSPDSTRIAFDAAQPNSRLVIVDVASRRETELTPTGLALRLGDWSPDGQYLTYEQDGGAKKSDVWLLYLKDQTLPLPQVSTSGVDRDAVFSPDSHSIAYVSERDGRDDVFVQIFPVAGVTTRVSTDGGRRPRWSAATHELFFQAADGLLMSAGITPAPNLAVTEVRKLFPLAGALQDVSGDGQRFLVLAPAP